MTWLIALLVGLLLGALSMAWFLFGNRIRWKIPAHPEMQETFRDWDRFWTQLVIGDASVQRVNNLDEPSHHFVRMAVHKGENDQLVLAQIDDYLYRPMADYAWRPPLRATARMRFSENTGPGTAGWYLWNNPIGLGAELPDFRPFTWIGFYRFPSGGTLDLTDVEASFRASIVNGSWPGLAAMFGVPFLKKPFAVESGLDGLHDWTQWHIYTIEWRVNQVRLLIDDEPILESATRIRGPLSLVFWYDNNHPQVKNGEFNLEYEAINSSHWLDLDTLTIQRL